MLYHNLASLGSNNILTYKQFTELFTLISITINSDEYFEVFLLNTFKLLHTTPRKNVYAGGAGGRKNYDPH